MERRCVITGMGAVTPVGNDVDTTWENIKNGVNGIGYITKFDTEEFKVKIAGEVKNFNAELYVDKKDLKRNDMFSIIAIAAAQQAFDMAGLVKEEITEEEMTEDRRMEEELLRPFLHQLFRSRNHNARRARRTIKRKITGMTTEKKDFQKGRNKNRCHSR